MSSPAPPPPPPRGRKRSRSPLRGSERARSSSPSQGHSPSRARERADAFVGGPGSPLRHDGSLPEDILFSQKGGWCANEIAEGSYLGESSSAAPKIPSCTEFKCLQLPGSFIGESSSAAPKIPSCIEFTSDEIYSITGGFNNRNLLPEFGRSVYEGDHDIFGKVLIKIFEKDNANDYDEGVYRLAAASSRSHPNIVELIGGLIEKKRAALVYKFPYCINLKERFKGETSVLPISIYHRYKIALGVAKAFCHLWDQDIPLLPKSLTDEHIVLYEFDTPVLVDLVGCGGTGDFLDSTLHLSQHYGIILHRLRILKVFHESKPTLDDDTLAELNRQCLDSNPFKRPLPYRIVEFTQFCMDQFWNPESDAIFI